MNNQITYDDKVALNDNPLIPDINKCKADDMNEIKNKHNGCMNGSIPMGNIRVDSIRSKNMFSGVGVSGVRIDTSTGGTFANSTYSVSKYIETKSSTNYTITFTGRYCYYVWYDSTQTYISGGYLDNNTSNITVQSPANAKYIRFDFITADEGQIQIEEGSTATSYSSYQGLGYKSGSNSNGNYIKYDDGTLIQWGTISKSLFLQPNDIYTTVQNIKWYRSDPPTVQIPVNFINTNYSLNITVTTGADGTRIAIPRISSKLSNGFQLQLISVEDFTSSGKGYTNLISVDWCAEGRWY